MAKAILWRRGEPVGILARMPWLWAVPSLVSESGWKEEARELVEVERRRDRLLVKIGNLLAVESS